MKTFKINSHHMYLVPESDLSLVSLKILLQVPSFTKLASWSPKAMHRLTLCPNALWNSHQASFHDPRFRSVFRGNFSQFVTPDILNNSLQDTRNLGRVFDFSLPFVLGSSLLATHDTYLESVLFSVEVLLTRKGRARLLSLGLGCLKCDQSFF